VLHQTIVTGSFGKRKIKGLLLLVHLTEILFLGKQKKVQTYIPQNHQEQNPEVNYTVIPYQRKNFKRKTNLFFHPQKDVTNQLMLAQKKVAIKELKAQLVEESPVKAEKKKNRLVLYLLLNTFIYRLTIVHSQPK